MPIMPTFAWWGSWGLMPLGVNHEQSNPIECGAVVWGGCLSVSRVGAGVTDGGLFCFCCEVGCPAKQGGTYDKAAERVTATRTTHFGVGLARVEYVFVRSID